MQLSQMQSFRNLVNYNGQNPAKGNIGSVNPNFCANSKSEIDALRRILEGGKMHLSEDEIALLFHNCQRGRSPHKGPIPNYLKRIEALLQCPEELKVLNMFSDPIFGIWMQIQDPLDSTVKKFPKIFKDNNHYMCNPMTCMKKIPLAIRDVVNQALKFIRHL